jgi:hypothetical protein
MFTENQKQEIKEILKNPGYSHLHNSLDINYLLDYDCDNLDEFQEHLNDYINEHEIIYYYVAMDFLKDYDNSLKESLNIASELCYSTENLTSEVLATLLIQKYMHEEASELIEEIETILEQEEEEN